MKQNFWTKQNFKPSDEKELLFYLNNSKINSKAFGKKYPFSLLLINHVLVKAGLSRFS